MINVRKDEILHDRSIVKKNEVQRKGFFGYNVCPLDER
jgi:hypothetical protein